MSSAAELATSFDTLEARMASFRARSRTGSTVNSVRSSAPEEKQPPIGSPMNKPTADPINYDAFITPISAANVISPNSFHQRPKSLSLTEKQPLSSSAITTPPSNSTPAPLFTAASDSPPLHVREPPSPLTTSSRLGSARGHTKTISLSNLPPTDDGWQSTGEETHTSTPNIAVPPERSPTGGLVLSYKSDGEGNGSMSARRKNSTTKGPTTGTEHLQSWAEAQAVQQEKDRALLSARKKREERRGENSNTRSHYQPSYGNGTPASSSNPSTSSSSSSSSAAPTISSPLTARSRAAAEAAGIVIPASSGSREMINALAAAEQKRREQKAAPALPTEGRSSAAGGMTPRTRTPRVHTARGDRPLKGQPQVDPSQLDQDDMSIYNSSTFVPISSRPPGAASSSSSAMPSSRTTGRNAPRTTEQQRRIAEQKERIRLKKIAALEAITKASTPVALGGTLGAPSSSSTSSSSSTVTRNNQYENPHSEGQPDPNAQDGDDEEHMNTDGTYSSSKRRQPENRTCDFKTAPSCTIQ